MSTPTPKDVIEGHAATYKRGLFWVVRYVTGRLTSMGVHVVVEERRFILKGRAAAFLGVLTLVDGPS